ncbi:gamma-glutamylcyclotransferase family protein [Puia sp.]|jgi:gamma-glutamylcyclotransferase (GGCT)/AIG2-like uncharacterized protein YtfP|uniref:gamma-glutamylcyclotransferase family protein n=1 Tax=Puia sp. TaxID=2045100 RepID=UPI002F413812
MIDYLFVYGTLRKRYDLKLKDKLREGWKYVGQAKIGAAMYDIGSYPGAVKDRSGREVVGDVFLVHDPGNVFRVLDKYEGREFVRKKGKVRMRNGQELNAWIYWYNFQPAGKPPIRYKDYLNYLKNKSIH